jgi:multimeric flavodoxin WrbA
MICEEVGGTMVKLELEKPYPQNYQAQVDQVVQENANNDLPLLKTVVSDINNYDTIFVGAPTWDMQLPPPMKSFLNQYNLSGKAIIPFNTNAGYGVGSSFTTIQELCKNSRMLEGFSVEGGKERDGILFVMQDDEETEVRQSVKDWLERIGIKS